LSPAKRRRLTITTNAVGLCYSLMFVVKGTDMAMAMYALGDTSTGLMQTPLWLPASLVPISGVLLSLQFLSHTIDNIAQGSH
jgi:TRAP-type C4-dicarboxylate transport system permease small subunit